MSRASGDEDRPAGAGGSPPLAGLELQWRRRIVLRGPMPCEVRHQGETLGSIRPVRTGLGRAEYEARWGGSGAWRFSGQGLLFSGRTGQAYASAPADADATPVLTSRRTRFRQRQIRVAGGPTFLLRQVGFAGTRYELSESEGSTLLEARNTGGPLRWSGTIRLQDIAARRDQLLPLLVLYSLFLVFMSPEVQL